MLFDIGFWNDVERATLQWQPEVNMSFSLDLNDEQTRRLEERARELGVDPRDLAKAAVNDLLSRADDDFDRAAKRVLEKNRELYRRLISRTAQYAE